VTPEVAKHRVFVWMGHDVLPDHKLHVFARDDDFFFGVLQSRIHEAWTLAHCSWLGVGNDPSYSGSRTFETFPFPWLPGKELQGDPKVQAIAAAARELVYLRDEWLAGKGLPDLPLNQRTLTNLYNKRPDWLEKAHCALDQAVLDAYSWPHDMSNDEVLARLLALNLSRAAVQRGVAGAIGRR
jgi:type II restriction/modification system DNA methylase subunit YeeA